MKKAHLILACIILNLGVYAQLSPVENLEFEQWYEYPDNFFELSWTCNPSEGDVLMGFNVYRNDEFYTFTEDTSLYCYPHGYGEDTGNCTDEFLLLNNAENGFYIHVTAVYNTDSVESTYTDSVECTGMALEIDNDLTNSTSIYPNPSHGTININNGNFDYIELIGSNGKMIKKWEGKEVQSTINVKDISKGIYILVLKNHGNTIRKKIVLE